MKNFLQFVSGSFKLMAKGSRAYYAWLTFLVLLSIYGLTGVISQFSGGLILTNMRDQVSWAYYIGNFTFLVGVAAAAVMLVIPAYIYNWKPIKEIAILGELLAISAVIMCLGFVIVDIGRPDRFWHLIPFLGIMNFPDSLLAWDVLVLTGYLLLNIFIVGYLLNSSYHSRPYKKSIVVPLVLLSIPMAVAIHTVTAFLYNGLAARPFWNASILAPRFLASAFCSGPAILLIILQILKKTTNLDIKKEAIWKIAELMAYAMAFNLFLLGAEVFKEFYSAAEHMVYIKYLFFGLEGHNAIVPYAWISVISSIIALVLFLVPKMRRNPITMNIGAALILIGVYIEKGVGLVVPGLTPDALGEIYEYFPSGLELRIALGIFALGFLVFTLMIKVAVPISLGKFQRTNKKR